MLYDNAQLIDQLTVVWQRTRAPLFEQRVRETIGWTLREMTAEGEAFASSFDADSEGEEGKFYVWTIPELESLLGSDSRIVREYYGVTPGGNFEGRNILHVRIDQSLAAARAGIKRELLDRIIADAKSTLYAVRARRIPPARDEKILASWNGLMLRGIATAARAFERDDFAKIAINNGEFLYSEMIENGRVSRSHSKNGKRIQGFLEDYAAVALGFISLYELTFEVKWVDRATELARSMVEWFWDEQLGAFFDTPRDAEALITRPREATDNAMPSGTSLAVDLLLSLAELTHDADMRRRATFVLETLATPLIRYPSAFGHMLGAADMAVNGAVEVAIAGVPVEKNFKALLHELANHYVPSLVLAGGSDQSGIALMQGRTAARGKATAYVCRSYACEEPAPDAATLAAQLENAGRLTVQY
jgi:uncharacterized protein YyaL (SSP411 family)